MITLKTTPLLKWCKDGIYILQGPLKGMSLTKLYNQDEGVIDMLEDLSFEMDLYNKKAIKQAIEDLRAM
jgi:hypothetical protein